MNVTTRQRRDTRGPCALCRRDTRLTFHHLIPKKLHRRPRFRRQYERDTLNRGIYICRTCHRGIHRRFDEMTLGLRFNTPEALLADEPLRRHFAWAAKQKVSAEDR